MTDAIPFKGSAEEAKADAEATPTIVEDHSKHDDTIVDPTPKETGKEDGDYLEQMANKADEGLDPNKVNEDAPDPKLLAGKYKDRDALIKAINELQAKDKSDEDLVAMYKALEKGVGTDDDADDSEDVSEDDDTDGADGDSDQSDSDGDSDDSDSDDDADDKSQLKDALGHDAIAKYTEEMATDGKLSEESLKALADAGITSDQLDIYQEGVQARLGKIYDRAGGKEQLQTMIDWAAENYSEDQIAAYDEAMNSGEMQKINDAVSLLKANYSQAEGIAPGRRIEPNSGGTPRAAGYQSKAEMMKDMGSEQYQKDPAFRARVIAKVNRTTAF